MNSEPLPISRNDAAPLIFVSSDDDKRSALLREALGDIASKAVHPARQHDRATIEVVHVGFLLPTRYGPAFVGESQQQHQQSREPPPWRRDARYLFIGGQ